MEVVGRLCKRFDDKGNPVVRQVYAKHKGLFFRRGSRATE